MASRLPSKRIYNPRKEVERKKHAPPPPPTKPWNPTYAEVARVMAAAGRTNEQIAERIGVSERHFYEWKRENPALGQALISGRDGTYEEVESATLKSILGGKRVERVLVADKETGELAVNRIVEVDLPPNGELGLKWLERRNPERWAPKAQDINVNLTFRRALMELAELDPDD